MTCPSWVALHGMAHSFIELDRAVVMWSVWLIFCDCCFHSVCPLRDKVKRLWKLPDERDWLWGKLGLFLMLRAMLSKSLILFSVDGRGSVRSLLVDLRPNYGGTSLVAQRLKSLPPIQETRVRSLGQEDPLEKEMATHSSILAWEIPWTEEPGGLQSTASQRVGHDWAISLHFLVEIMKIIATSFKKSGACTAAVSAPDPAA